MSHDHHEHHHTKNLQTAFFLNLFFTLIEIVGGILTNSMAILSDALHDLGDSLSLGLSWYFERLSKRKRDHVFSYGYKRFSLLGALINSIVLIIGSMFILSEAIPRLLQPQPADAQGMILLAILGILVNGAAVLRLKGAHSINEKVVSLHLWEDVLGWAAVLIGAIVMQLTGWIIIDSILSLLIAGYVLFNVYKNLKETLKIILQSIPSEIDIRKIENYFENLNDIKSYHDLHIWTMDGTFNVLTVHLMIPHDEKLSRLEEIKEKIRKDLYKLGIQHSTFEIESSETHCDLDEC